MFTDFEDGRKVHHKLATMRSKPNQLEGKVFTDFEDGRKVHHKLATMRSKPNQLEGKDNL